MGELEEMQYHGKLPMKLKGNVYRTVVRPAMLFRAETRETTE